jgi:hypothetical protein
VSYGVSFEKVHLVDFYVSNFVFRGDEVINKTNNVFEYDLLVEYMKVSFFFFVEGTHTLSDPSTVSNGLRAKATLLFLAISR